VLDEKGEPKHKETVLGIPQGVLGRGSIPSFPGEGSLFAEAEREY